MKAFHMTFIAADAGLDERVCKDGSNGGDGKKCKAADTDTANNQDNLGHAYKDGGAVKVEASDAEKIAKSISKLSKGE